MAGHGEGTNLVTKQRAVSCFIKVQVFNSPFSLSSSLPVLHLGWSYCAKFGLVV